MKERQCPKCSEPVFEVIPRQTTWRSIEEFLRSAVFDAAGEALAEQWLHPGGYCRRHGGIDLVESMPSDLRDEHEYRLFLSSCGPRRHQVLLLRQRLDISLRQAKALLDGQRPQFAAGYLREVSDLGMSLEQAGAWLEVEQYDRTSGALVRMLDGIPADFSRRRVTRKTSRAVRLNLQPIKDEEGKVRVLMDESTARHLGSDAPNPSQKALEELLLRVTRVRVMDGGTEGGEAVGNEVLLATGDPRSIASLHRCLVIVEDPGTFGHCMCQGDVAIELCHDARLAAVIGLHHGRSIRWDAWKYDAWLQDGTRLLDWLAERGVTGPREEFKADEARAEQTAQEWAKWKAATPACLLSLLEAMTDVAILVDTAPWHRALEAAYPGRKSRILELFRWFGSGSGLWNGFPSYESIPEKLLLDYETRDLVEALADHALTGEQWEGAARHFAGWSFRHDKKGRARLLPPELQRRLLEHALAHSAPDNASSGRRAFGG